VRERDVFGYLEPHPDIPDFAQCSSCQSWLKPIKRCYWLAKDKEVLAGDSCIFYAQGKPLEKRGVEPTGTFDPKDVGFVSGQVRCENCISLAGDDKTCKLFARLNGFKNVDFWLDEDVKPRGCCNAFESKEGKVVGKSNVTVDEIAAYLFKNEPAVAEMLLKDMTVGDVHIPASLKDVSVAYIQDDKEPKEIENDDPAADPGRRAYGEDSPESDEREDAVVLADDDDDGDDDDPDALDAEGARRSRSSVGKRWTLKIAKSEPDQRKVFGWASIAAIDGEAVVDKQDDIIPVDELEKAVHEFGLNSRTHCMMHAYDDGGAPIPVGRMIESTLFNAEKRACGLVAKDELGRTIDGWWVGLQVDHEPTWNQIKAGRLPEFSIGGKAMRCAS